MVNSLAANEETLCNGGTFPPGCDSAALTTCTQGITNTCSAAAEACGEDLECLKGLYCSETSECTVQLNAQLQCYQSAQCTEMDFYKLMQDSLTAGLAMCGQAGSCFMSVMQCMEALDDQCTTQIDECGEYDMKCTADLYCPDNSQCRTYFSSLLDCFDGCTEDPMTGPMYLDIKQSADQMDNMLCECDAATADQCLSGLQDACTPAIASCGEDHACLKALYCEADGACFTQGTSTMTCLGGCMTQPPHDQQFTELMAGILDAQETLGCPDGPANFSIFDPPSPGPTPGPTPTPCVPADVAACEAALTDDCTSAQVACGADVGCFGELYCAKEGKCHSYYSSLLACYATCPNDVTYSTKALVVEGLVTAGRQVAGCPNGPAGMNGAGLAAPSLVALLAALLATLF